MLICISFLILSQPPSPSLALASPVPIFFFSSSPSYLITNTTNLRFSKEGLEDVQEGFRRGKARGREDDEGIRWFDGFGISFWFFVISLFIISLLFSFDIHLLHSSHLTCSSLSTSSPVPLHCSHYHPHHFSYLLLNSSYNQLSTSLSNCCMQNLPLQKIKISRAVFLNGGRGE